MRTKNMKCVINLTGRTNTSVAAELPEEWFEDEKCFDLLYNYICGEFPDNDWEDIVCKNIIYKDNITLVSIGTY